MQTEKDSNGDVEPAYDHVIPSPVFYDERLSGDDKLLYGLIRALCRKEGYCWASNDYLARKFKVDERTIRRRIRSLANAGHVRVEISKKEGNVRRIWLRTNVSLPTDKSVHTPTDKSVTHSKERKKMKKQDEETSPPSARRNGESLPINETVLGAIACGAGKYKSAKARKRGREADALGLIVKWQQAWKEVFPKAPPPTWTQKDKGALLGYRKKFRDVGRTDFEEYMEWCVQYWPMVNNAQFKGWHKRPELPAVLWWVKYASFYENMYADYKATKGVDMTKTLLERMIDELIPQGFTPEAAKREAEYVLGFGKMREKLEEKERKVKAGGIWLYGRLSQVHNEVMTTARRIIAENPTASRETLMKLTTAEIDNMWKELEKGLGDYERSEVK